MKKILASLFLTISLLLVTAGAVSAQDTTTTPLTGTILSLSLVTDPVTGETTVQVDFTDDAGNTQSVQLSVETAAGLGLVSTDPLSGDPTVTPGLAGTNISIDPTTVLASTGEDEKQHPVGSALADFFSELLGVDYESIMSYHEDGTGFGVIAQALWMTKQLDGDTATFEALLDAKKSGDFSAITLADGSTPRNWGDVVKSLKKGENLGSVKSGHADSDAKNNSSKKHNDQTIGTENSTSVLEEKSQNNGQQNQSGEHGNKNKPDKSKGGHGKP